MKRGGWQACEVRALFCRTVRNTDLWRLPKRLIDDAVPFGEAEQCGQLLFRRVGCKVELKADALQPNRGVLGDSKRASKI